MVINIHALCFDLFYSFDNVRSSFMKRQVMFAVILALYFALKLVIQFFSQLKNKRATHYNNIESL